MKSNVDYNCWFAILLKKISKFSSVYFITLNCDKILWNSYVRASSNQSQFFSRVNYQIVDVKHKLHLYVNRNFFSCGLTAFIYETSFSFLVTYWAG